MNDQFLQGVIFDWNRIDNDSYLKRIMFFLRMIHIQSCVMR